MSFEVRRKSVAFTIDGAVVDASNSAVSDNPYGRVEIDIDDVIALRHACTLALKMVASRVHPPTGGNDSFGPTEAL